MQDLCLEIKDAATDKNYRLCYDLNVAPRGQKLILLTEGGVTTFGTITDPEAAKKQGVWAWCRLPVRDKALEEKLGLTKKPEHIRLLSQLFSKQRALDLQLSWGTSKARQLLDSSLTKQDSDALTLEQVDLLLKLLDLHDRTYPQIAKY